MKLGKVLAGLIFLGAAFAANVQAQLDIRGQINGRVVNQNNAGVKRVDVLLLDLTTLETQFAVTNQFGYFQFTGLPVGNFYLIQAQSSRIFIPYTAQTVNLDSVFRFIVFQASDFPVSLPKAPARDF